MLLSSPSPYLQLITKLCSFILCLSSPNVGYAGRIHATFTSLYLHHDYVYNWPVSLSNKIRMHAVEDKIVNGIDDIENKYSSLDTYSKLIPKSNPLTGKHKWLGGALDKDGCIYGVPSHSRHVICLSPQRNDGDEWEYRLRLIDLPESVADGRFKWLRGIIQDGYLYGIPAWAKTGVLKVDIDRLWGRRNNNHDNTSDIVSVLPLPRSWDTVILENEGRDDEYDHDRSIYPEKPERWLWHGASLNSNRTAIYCIPSNAHQVLKVDLAQSMTSVLSIPLSKSLLRATNKWYGGILGRDNAVYGVPYAASGVMRIDTNNDIVEIIGDFGLNCYNWHGGILSPHNGAIYAFPAHHSHVLKIDTSPGISSHKRISLLPINWSPYDDRSITKYKWLGGCLGADGNIYGMPSDAKSILRINTKTDEVTTFGSIGEGKNKWHGGVLSSDGFIYCIPKNAEEILRIDTRPRSPVTSSLITERISYFGKLSSTKDKLQGGFVGLDGRIYCIPESFDHVVKVSPSVSMLELI